ncbi:MAG: hypothetical protein ACK5ZG_07890 [Phycisphaerae bacterium]|jgi:hypothetical protein
MAAKPLSAPRKSHASPRDDKPLEEAAIAARALREQLQRITRSILPAEPRLRDWITQLSLDKSLASRANRFMQSDDEQSLLRDVPSLTGMAIIAEACRQRGAGPRLTQALLDAAQAWETTAQRVPGGRAGLRAALSARADSVREDVERDAGRMLFQGMASLTGSWIDMRHTVFVIAPSSTPGRFDMAVFLQWRGIHRVRCDKPIVLASLSGAPDNTQPSRFNLDGSPLAADPRASIIEPCSNYPAHALHFHRLGNACALLLARDATRMDESIDFAIGMRYGGYIPAIAPPRETFVCIPLVVRRPTRQFSIDVMLAPGIWPGVAPINAFAFSAADPPDLERGPFHDVAETIDLGATYQPAESQVNDAYEPARQELTSIGFERLGWNPAGYRRFRLQLRFPPPLISVQTWFSPFSG